MSMIEVDLEDYKDEIKSSFCENNRCLMQECRRDISEKFGRYIDDLRKSIYFFNDCKKTPEDFLNDLESLYSEMR